MDRFKVGDLVIGASSPVKGLTGIVEEVYDGFYGVRFDTYDEMFHSLGGLIPPGHGFYCGMSMLSYHGGFENE